MERSVAVGSLEEKAPQLGLPAPVSQECGNRAFQAESSTGAGSEATESSGSPALFTVPVSCFGIPTHKQPIPSGKQPPAGRHLNPLFLHCPVTLRPLPSGPSSASNPPALPWCPSTAPGGGGARGRSAARARERAAELRGCGRAERRAGVARRQAAAAAGFRPAPRHAARGLRLSAAAGAGRASGLEPEPGPCTRCPDDAALTMPPAAPARLALALGLGLWLGALAGGPGRGCGPCAPPCLCGPAPGGACRVNCSGRGLRTLGPALRIPADATALGREQRLGVGVPRFGLLGAPGQLSLTRGHFTPRDLSSNLLRALDGGLLANLSALRQLDISNNRISVLEEATFANLLNLSEISLGGNPLACDCGLAWLPRWAEQRQVRLARPEVATCAGPGPLAGRPLLSVPWSGGGCGEEFVACLPDNSSHALAPVAFTAVHPGPLAPQACAALCFGAGRGLAALSEQGQCLCGAQHPDASACRPFCLGPALPPACGAPTLLPDVFPASPGAALVGPSGPLASGQPAAFHITAPLPVSATRWDFGDGSPEVAVAGPTATHRYMLPGRYTVTAQLAVGAGSARLGAEVRVEAVPTALELLCPASVISDQALELGIRNRGGSDLEATYRIMSLDGEPAQVVHPLCPPDTAIFPGSGRCYRLVAEKAAWLQAQEQCRAWAGAALAMVDSAAVQHFLVSQVTRSLDVWIGFSPVGGTEAGPAPQGEAFSLESCQNWLPGEPHPATAERCVRLGPAGQCNTDLCSVPHSFVCELRPGGPVRDAQTFLVGAPSGDLQGPPSPLAPLEALSAPRGPVEVGQSPGPVPKASCLCPPRCLGFQALVWVGPFRWLGPASPRRRCAGLREVAAEGLGPGAGLAAKCPHQVLVLPGLGREAFLTAAEFGTQALGQPVQLRLQVFRPQAAGGPLWAPGALVTTTPVPGLAPASWWAVAPEMAMAPAQEGWAGPGSGQPEALLGHGSAGLVLQELLKNRRPRHPLLAENSSDADSRVPATGTVPPPTCPPEGCQCPSPSACLPLGAPCQPQACASGSQPGPGSPGATCTLWKESLFSVPAGPPAQYSVRSWAPHSTNPALPPCLAASGLRTLPMEGPARCPVALGGPDAPLLPWDLVIMQHDAGPGALLQCPPAPGPTAPHFTARASAWLARLPAQLEPALASPRCALQLLAATERVTPLLGPGPNPGLRRPGRYEVRATVGNGVSRRELSCHFEVLSPVAGLQVMYPTPQDGRRYVPTVGAVLVLQADAGANATALARWPGGNASAPFAEGCPAQAAALVPGCAREANATQLSVLALPRLPEGELAVEVEVQSGAGRAHLLLPLRAEEPIRGLRATPSPEARVLQGVLVVSARPAARGRPSPPARRSLPAGPLTVPLATGSSAFPPAGGRLGAGGCGGLLSLSAARFAGGGRAGEGQPRLRAPLHGAWKGARPGADGHHSPPPALQRYSPVVDAGSDVAFRWTIDDKQSFTFHNVVFNVIYQSTAVFKLSLTASNHVSNVSVSYAVAVERMHRLSGLRVAAVPPVLPCRAALALAAEVLVDSAVDVTFLWAFGDGEQATGWFRPPYNESFPAPDPAVAQVRVEHRASHTYSTPGEYNLTLLVSNAFENLTQWVPVSVRAALPALAVAVGSQVPVAGRPITFSPHPPLPAGGILYSWDFGDGSPAERHRQPEVSHVFVARGAYRVCLGANNTVSSQAACARVQVLAEPRGLAVHLPPAVEQGAPTLVSASLEAGDNVTWTFDMGDGTVLTGPEPAVEHVYLRAQNSTVTVRASSPAGHLARSLPVQVFVLEVLRLDPAACIPTQPQARLTAHVPGDPAHYVFDWTFGDGSSNTTVRGDPSVTHNFTRSGTFPLALVLSSRTNRAHYFSSVCVEPEMGNLTLRPERQCVRLGAPARLAAHAWPPFPYRFAWDAGAEGAAVQAVGCEATITYRDVGSYLVTVTAANNVSAANDSALVEVQEPVELTGIGVNGSRVLELLQPHLFQALGRGRPATYLWELGDGGRLEGPAAVTHAYSSTGRFAVRVAGWNEVSRGEALLNVTVQQRVRGLSLNASRTLVPLNGSVSFSTALAAGSDVRYSWVLCDRCTPSPGGPAISYTFRSVGTFSVIVAAENELGAAQDSISVSVLERIEGLQVAGGCGSSSCPTNLTLQLQAVVREGTNVSYSWTAQREGGPVLVGSGRTFSLAVPEAGTYHVQLRATNMLGSASANRTLDFVEPVGGLAMSASPNPAAVGTTVALAALLASGSGVTYTWSLETGQSWGTLGPATSHAFPAPGLHWVTVTAQNQLGAANASVQVAVQVPVSGLSIRAGAAVPRVVAAGSTLSLWGQLATGTDVSWCWALPTGDRRGQHVAVAFPDAGAFSLRLNASNAVSWATAAHNLTVEAPVLGLALWASSKVAEPGQPVHFQVLMATGSAVSFHLQVNGAGPETLPGPHFSRSFPRVGDYVVAVQAENRVSRAQVQVRVLVLEAVAGLQVPGCCEPAIATGAERNFTASVQRGSRVAYAWYFSLQKVQGDSLVILSGRDVTYTPVAAGLLEIHVRAFNELGGMNRTLLVEVQDVIEHVALQGGRCFTNRSARFQAATSPSPRHVAFRWDFGDGAAQATEGPWAEHTYLQPGDYRVEVNASNLVSFFVAQATVTVHVLACREPQVEVALPPQVLMRRAQRNYLEAHVDLRGCVTYQTEYRWEVYRAASCQRPRPPARVALPGVDMSRPQLVVPRLALPVGHYCFVFAVSFGDTPLARSIQANVTVAPERLVPIVGGGSYRVWSDAQDLLLDGSQSYDPNLEDGDQTPLSFHWACVASTQPGSRAAVLQGAGGCALNFGPRGSSLVTIPRERLQAGVEYTFSLAVWKAGRREETTNQTVLIRSGRVPIVSLECVSCRAQAVYAVSRSSYVHLEGRCDNCSGGAKRGRWAARTFSNRTLVLDETTTSTGSSDLRLVVRRGVLRDGEGYVFTLTVLGPAGQEEGCASLRLSATRPPRGGSCRLFPLGAARALTTKVYFACTGWRDAEDAAAPLVYALLLRRCRQGHCEEFCVYKGSLATYGAVLPPGFGPHFRVYLAVQVQDQLGAAVVALNRSLAIALPEPPGHPADLTAWLHSLTEGQLPGLLRQADPQHVIEYSLALITVLNEHEQSLAAEEPERQRQLRAQIRKNVTETLVSLRVHTVDDIQQIAAALAQCTVSRRELVCRSCLKPTLHKLEAMMRILQQETAAGTRTPPAIADSILNITGGLIHLASADVQGPQHLEPSAEPPSPSLMVASRAYHLSSALMRILMRARVLNEEPLTLAGEEIVAQGKRADPQGLLCYGDAASPGCHFAIPPAFSGALSNLSDVVQLIFLVDSNPFPFGYISNYTVSTKVASMAFQTQTGARIPIGQLASERAIVVTVPSSSGQQLGAYRPAGSAVLQPQASVTAVVAPENSNPAAGLHLQLTYTVLDGGCPSLREAPTLPRVLGWAGESRHSLGQGTCPLRLGGPGERYLSEEPEPYLAVYLHTAPWPSEHNCSASRRISLQALAGTDHRPYTFFVAPGAQAPGGRYYLNLTSHFQRSALEVSLSLYSSLCQYFSEEDMAWRTEGLVPLDGTSPRQAVCLTRHLTAFGASLFVPPSRVHFIFPEPPSTVNYVVLLTCTVCLVTYAVMVVVLRKLDQLDASRVRAIPFCGQRGRFKYEILVKTGWGRGSGTTAHVGIVLYGADSRSGHRHLDGDGAFHRNSLDIFQIATPHSLGSVWKIRVWHDNKGLSPAWFLQHVIVRDLQSARSTFFLVNDWLSVETEANGGLVEKEVLAASDAALRRCRRLLVCELQRGFFDKHIWLSVWDRPPRSRFTRVQRATCCAVLLCLFLGANAVWYGVVGDAAYSPGPVSRLVPPGMDAAAVGLVSSVLVYPAYLVILFLFRMSRSKVGGDRRFQGELGRGPPAPARAVVSSQSMAVGVTAFGGASHTAHSLPDQERKDEPRSWGQLQLRRLSPLVTLVAPARGWGCGVAGGPRSVGRQVLDSDGCLDSALDSSFLTTPGPRAEALAGQVTSDLFLGDSKSLVCWPSSEGTLSWPDLLSDPCIMGSALQRLAQGPEDDGLSLVTTASPAKYFAASDEALARRSPAPAQDVAGDTDLLGGLCGAPGERTEALVLQRLGPKGLPGPGLGWEQAPLAMLPGTGLVEGLRRRLLPAWCSTLAHGLSLLLVAVAVGVSGWVGAGFPPHVSVTWLLSSSSSFLASFLGWEPLKVLLEALYFSLVAKRLHPDEDDTLVESPAVTPVSERVPRVRPPHGFALFLAKEEARKVKRLHGLLRVSPAPGAGEPSGLRCPPRVASVSPAWTPALPGLLGPQWEAAGVSTRPGRGPVAVFNVAADLQSLLVYMLFLLVALLATYGDASHHGHAYRLQNAIKQQLDSRAFLAITRSEEFWPWMAHVLLPAVLGNQSSPELGPLRLRQVRLREGELSSWSPEVPGGLWAAPGPGSFAPFLVCEWDAHVWDAGAAPGAARRGGSKRRLVPALFPDPSGVGSHRCAPASGGFSTSDFGIGWATAAHGHSEVWAYSAPDLLGAWYWGCCGVYDSGGYVQELGPGLEQSRARLAFLQEHSWIDDRSRAVFVELTRYSPAVGLHAAVTLRLEFPTAGRAVAAFSVRPFALRRLSAGLSLPLLTSVSLLLFALYFAVAEVRAWRREGRVRARRSVAWARWLLVALTAAAALVRLAQLGAADRQWARFVRRRPRRFTSFDQVAQLSASARGLAASLLFLLLVKAAQQLRFVRQWSVFGKTLGRALPELVGAALGLAALAAAYAQLVVLLASSCTHSLRSATRALLVLCPGTGGPTLCPAESWRPAPLLCAGLWALRLWGALRLGAVLLRWRYHALRGELYRPAWEPQDYEMVELFLRRLRLWMGFSKVKEFRHKVRFEGMEPLPSRSSKASPDAPPPSGGSDTSRPSTSSSQLDVPGGRRSRPGPRGEPEPSRLQAVFEALLAQFDRLNQATEDVYQLEWRLQRLQRPKGSLSPGAPPPSSSPGPWPALPSRLARASRGMGLGPGPSRTSLRAKSKVHPSST
ncbi:Polycystin-1 [Galemys pyrenaicus]|uniref:Polycystin-1 n=1 Tax=Galemys pyrenaicus TaxID=202257 RepID=A0A8J5ZSZ7_GALPY|nr:Polycystin-1 [Galemys pyrenaicus]